MLRLGQFVLLLILAAAIFSIPTSYSKSNPQLFNLFKQIHNKKAVGDALPYDHSAFSDNNGYGFDNEPLFVIV
ncbi:unnamed protein product [Caenorhabditis angaria]|uniref:Uncharacterized protein n=1 Tax=Caenorhabditis angaria TaxID=860376 RepID=A0A9P1J280_9PELO|nr:unnamed protein product [Caenorhabditis angaria]